ncbi:hypothetical protein VTH82DRAFT_5345 [Thermothelomyces myriococcoides]
MVQNPSETKNLGTLGHKDPTGPLSCTARQKGPGTKACKEARRREGNGGQKVQTSGQKQLNRAHTYRGITTYSQTLSPRHALPAVAGTAAVEPDRQNSLQYFSLYLFS